MSLLTIHVYLLKAKTEAFITFNIVTVFILVSVQPPPLTTQTIVIPEFPNDQTTTTHTTTPKLQDSSSLAGTEAVKPLQTTLSTNDVTMASVTNGKDKDILEKDEKPDQKHKSPVIGCA